MVNEPPRAKREIQAILVNELPRAKREAQKYWSTFHLERIEKLKESWSTLHLERSERLRNIGQRTTSSEARGSGILVSDYKFGVIFGQISKLTQSMQIFEVTRGQKAQKIRQILIFFESFQIIPQKEALEVSFSPK